MVSSSDMMFPLVARCHQRNIAAGAATTRLLHIAARVAGAYVRDMSEAKDQPAQQPQATEMLPASPPKPKEIGGPKGPEPTRYGDWEVNGRCTDF
jgi:hypothetical protein